MTTNTGGPAFPRAAGDYNGSKGGNGPQTGMTLRDYFAAKAMDGFNKRMTDYGWPDEVLEEHAIQAYRIADAMLKAREA